MPCARQRGRRDSPNAKCSSSSAPTAAAPGTKSTPPRRLCRCSHRSASSRFAFPVASRARAQKCCRSWWLWPARISCCWSSPASSTGKRRRPPGSSRSTAPGSGWWPKTSLRSDFRPGCARARPARGSSLTMRRSRRCARTPRETCWRQCRNCRSSRLRESARRAQPKCWPA